MDLASVFYLCSFNAGFTKENTNPTNLVYILNADTNTAEWATYDQVISDWTKQYIGENKETKYKTIANKYNARFTQVSSAPLKNIATPKIEKTKDIIIGDLRHISLYITSQRNVNRLEIYTNYIEIEKALINNIPIDDTFLKLNPKKNLEKRLITHYISNNEYTEIDITIVKGKKLELTLYEALNDLLNNPLFTIAKRPENQISKPFVLNDAILVTKTITF